MLYVGEAMSKHFEHCFLETLVGILIAYLNMILSN